MPLEQILSASSEQSPIIFPVRLPASVFSQLKGSPLSVSVHDGSFSITVGDNVFPINVSPEPAKVDVYRNSSTSQVSKIGTAEDKFMVQNIIRKRKLSVIEKVHSPSQPTLNTKRQKLPTSNNNRLSEPRYINRGHQRLPSSSSESSPEYKFDLPRTTTTNLTNNPSKNSLSNQPRYMINSPEMVKLAQVARQFKIKYSSYSLLYKKLSSSKPVKNEKYQKDVKRLIYLHKKLKDWKRELWNFQSRIDNKAR